MTTKLFYDSEFTGLTQDTSLISLALISETGASLYAEFSDYKREQVDDWLRDNVLQHCQWLNTDSKPFAREVAGTEGMHTEIYGDSAHVTTHLRQWLSQFEQIEVWADCPAWDWVLFAQLFGGALGLPKNIHYMPADISMLFRLNGHDPDCDREKFAGLSDELDKQAAAVKHNALSDARVAKACYDKLMQLQPE